MSKRFWDRALEKALAGLSREQRRKAKKVMARVLDEATSCGKCGHQRSSHKRVRSGHLACTAPGCACLHPKKWPQRYARSLFASYPFNAK